MTWHDMTWYDVTWRDVTWRGVAWRGVAWRDVAWHDTTRHDTTRHGTARHDTTWHDVTGIFKIVRTRLSILPIIYKNVFELTKLARFGQLQMKPSPARWMRKPGPFYVVGLWAGPASAGPVPGRARSGPARRAAQSVQVSTVNNKNK